VFFKDVTFGVLYEQIKANQKLQTMISDTLSYKLSEPLDTLLSSCEHIEDNEEIKKVSNIWMVGLINDIKCVKL
jgi:hypothetical protein